MKNKFKLPGLLSLKTYLLVFPIGFLSLISCTEKYELKQPDVRLWYNQPAKVWEEALPVGNGRLGAMVFGQPFAERIQVNEESLWAGQPINNNNPDALGSLDELRTLLFQEKSIEAQRLVELNFLGTPPRIRSYQPAGNIFLIRDSTAKVDDYYRDLMLENGIATVKYSLNKTKYTQEVFASAPDNVIAIHIVSEGNEGIDLQISLKREKDASVQIENNQIVLTGQIIDEPDPLTGPGGKHMKFASLLNVDQKGGTLIRDGNCLRVEGSSEVTLLYTVSTDYNINSLNFDRSINPLKVCKDIIEEAERKSYNQLKMDHIKDHASIFNRVFMHLGKNEISNLPTDQRIKALKEAKVDPDLAALYFQFGRYLLMGSSRKPGKLPANLQGVWNYQYKAPWNADFHTNINLQMNYWPAEVANIPEALIPLSNFMDKLMVPGGKTAKEMYGARGWTFHHLTDPFGRTGVMDGPWGLTPMDGPWMTFPLFRHYEFTMDTVYLNQIYPILKGSLLFGLDFLTQSPEGYLVSNPSHSPENRYFLPDGERATLTYASTTDIQVLTALFNNFLIASEVLGKDPDLSNEVKDALKKFPPIKVGQNGTIQEWFYDYDEPEPGHRHMSHLLGLYPLNQMSSGSPELFEAARNTIEYRLSHGGGHTGWSRAWIINLYARLFDGNKAWEHLHLLLAKSTQNNLFDTHPPFQIDGNFGGTAGIAEMLLQSQGGFINLLPALPEKWPDGYVKGLRARGGFCIDMKWENNKLINVVVYSDYLNHCNLKYQDSLYEFDTKKDFKYEFDGNLNLFNENAIHR